SDGRHSIAEFFVMRKYRRSGLGTGIAEHIFKLFPGKWEVHQTVANTGAQAFWREVVGRVSDGAYEEVDGGDARPGPTQLFEVAP
ncbi:MAG: GNAT family N-acetyltransferase, partial [Actinomycetota bacterium]